MESVSDIAYAGNGISGDETVACNMSTVLIPSIDSNVGSVSDVQDLSNHLINASTNGVLSNKGCVNEMSSVFEMAKCDHLQNNCNNISVGNEGNSVSKIMPPTIFENAVKVVKNLFSPAKGHGIFSRGASQAVVYDFDMKKIPNEGINPLGGSFAFRLDQISATESQYRTSPIASFENNLNPNEEDVNNSTVKNSSNSIGTHDSTNDSYTTTVSGMDESFQSTITHFDEIVQNEVEKPNMPVILVGNCLDGSLNETTETNDNSLDNTLKKNISICSTVNGDLNNTFEVPIGKEENDGDKEFNVESECDTAQMQSPNLILQEIGTAANNQEVTGSASLSEEIFHSFQEKGMRKSGPPSSTPNKLNSSQENSPSEKAFLDLVSGKLQEFDRISEENNKLKNCAMENMNSVGLGPFSGMNHLSENEFSIFPVASNKEFTEKSSTPKSADLEKNFSTSTIILTKGESESLDFSSSKEEKEVIVMSHELLEKKDKAGTVDEINSITSAITMNQLPDPSSSISGSAPISNDVKMGDDLDMETNPDLLLESSTSTASNSGNVCNSSVKPDGTIVDFKTFNLINNVQAEHQKREGYPPTETGIPLASQKSYTVLHNLNPDLHRPVVLDYMCDVHAEKLNDIILGNCEFSDLGVFNNCSEELITDDAKNSSPQSNSMSNTMKPGETEATFESGNIDKENVGLSTTKVSEEICDALFPDKQVFDGGEVFPMLEDRIIDCAQSLVHNERVVDEAGIHISKNILSHSETPVKDVEAKVLASESIIACQDPILTFEVSSKVSTKGIKEEGTTLQATYVIPVSGDGIQNKSITENNTSGLQFCGDGNSAPTDDIKPITIDGKENFQEPDLIIQSNSSAEVSDIQPQMENLASDFARLKMNDSLKQDSKANYFHNNDSFPKLNGSLVSSDEYMSSENLKNMVKVPGSGSDTELTQFIQEQFTAFDIEKICSVVDDIPELNLSKNIVLASEKFDKSFHKETVIESDFSKANNFVMSDNNFMSSALDFLDSIKGKPSGRDYSRESLYIKFDPLVQLKHSTELSDVSEGDKENLIVSPGPKNTINTEPLIPITPLKQTINVSSPLSPLTPVTQKNEPKLSTEKLNKLWELQSEITRLRELSLQREEINKEKMNNYEKEITKLTGRACVLEDRLKESEEMEKSLVKKLNVQNESMNRLKSIVEEYVTYTAKLTDQIEMARMESQKKIKVLTEERDYYMNHLHSTEQAFSDVHSKYEKCKKALEVYRKNGETYKTSIDDLKERIEQYSDKIKDIQENAAKEVSRLQDKMNDMKLNHAQEISRFKAQLRKMELKVQTIQEALDQKVKENQELGRICDELIDGKK